MLLWQKIRVYKLNLLVDKKDFDDEIFVKVRSTGKLLNAKVDLRNNNRAEVNLNFPDLF